MERKSKPSIRCRIHDWYEDQSWWTLLFIWTIIVAGAAVLGVSFPFMLVGLFHLLGIHG